MLRDHMTVAVVGLVGPPLPPVASYEAGSHERTTLCTLPLSASSLSTRQTRWSTHHIHNFPCTLPTTYTKPVVMNNMASSLSTRHPLPQTHRPSLEPQTSSSGLVGSRQQTPALAHDNRRCSRCWPRSPGWTTMTCSRRSSRGWPWCVYYIFIILEGYVYLQR